MADTNNAEGAQPSATATETQAEQQAAQVQTDATDWKAEARKWEDRAKANRKAQEAAEEQLKAHADYDSIKAELEVLRAEKAREEAVRKAAKEHGVDAEMLGRMQGDVEENAKWLSERPKYAPVHDGGEGGSKPPEKSTAELFADAISNLNK